MEERQNAGARANGEPFRSWGEAQIGRMFTYHGIDYLYEHPLAVVDRGMTRIWYPDFQLPGYGLLLEYVGRPAEPECAARMAHKQVVYRTNGLAALMITPAWFRGDWPGRILGEIEGVLADRLHHVRARQPLGPVAIPELDDRKKSYTRTLSRV